MDTLPCMGAMQERADRRSAVQRIALARVVSVTGSTAAYTALTYAIYDRTGSTTWVSAAVFATIAAHGFLMPLGGAIGDRLDRRRVMIVSDLMAAVLFGVLAFVDDPALLIALAFVATVCELPFFPASTAAIPNLAHPDDLAWANGRVAGAFAIGITIGPAVAGVLIAAVGPGTAFALNALSFVASAVLVSTVRRSFREDRAAGEHVDSALRAGLVHVWRTASLRAIVIAEFVAFLGIGIVIVSDAPLAQQFDTGSVGYGLLVAFWGLGMIAGAWVAGRVANECNEPALMLGGMCALAVGLALCAIFPWFAAILAVTLVGGFGNGVVNVTRQGVVQRRAPDAVRSRVFAAVEAVGNASFIGSLAVSGVVVEAIGPQPAYGLGGVIFLVGSLLLAPSVLRAGGSLRAGLAPSRG
jgi:MFS family permease